MRGGKAQRMSTPQQGGTLTPNVDPFVVDDVLLYLYMANTHPPGGAAGGVVDDEVAVESDWHVWRIPTSLSSFLGWEHASLHGTKQDIRLRDGA